MDIENKKNLEEFNKKHVEMSTKYNKLYNELENNYINTKSKIVEIHMKEFKDLREKYNQ